MESHEGAASIAARDGYNLPRLKSPRAAGDPPFLDRGERRLLLHLHVVPGASKTELAGLHGDRLKIRVKAPPAEGAANRELVRFLGDLLNTAPTALEIVRGAGERRKTLSLPTGTDVAALGDARR